MPALVLKAAGVVVLEDLRTGEASYCLTGEGCFLKGLCLSGLPPELLTACCLIAFSLALFSQWDG